MARPGISHGADSALAGSILRVAVLLGAALWLALSFPPIPGSWVAISYFLLGVGASGLALSRSSTESWGAKRLGAAVIGVGVWAALLLVTLTIGAREYPGIRFGFVRPWLSRGAINSLWDILIVIGIFAGVMIAACVLIRKQTSISPVIIAILFIGLAELARHLRLDSKTVLSLWASELPNDTRFQVIVGLSNGVWLCAVLPLLLFRALYPERLQDLVSGSPRRWNTPVLLLLGIPFLTGIILMRLARVDIVDALPPDWWMTKALTSIVLVGVLEEAIYRVWLYGALLAVSRRLFFASAWPVAAVISSALFAVSHEGGVVPVTQAFGFGLVYCIVIRKSGNFDACVLAHALYNMVFSRWN